MSEGGLINTERFTAISSDRGCLDDEEKKCAGYSVSGYSTVMTDPKTGESSMLIDAELSWAGTEKSWDNTKSMEFGWMIETNSPEFRTEKVKFKSYPKGSRPSWDALGG